LFLGLAVVSFALGTGYAVNATILRRFADLLLAIALYFVVVNVVRTKDHLRWLTILLILGGFGAAAIAVALYFLPTHITVQLLGYLRVFNYFPNGSVVLRYIEDDPALPLRATGTANDPNVLGGMLLLTTAIATSQLFSPRPVLRRAYIAPMLAVMGLCLLLTFSRGSWGGLVVAVLLIGTAIDRRLWLVFLGGAAVLLLLPQMQTFIAHSISGLQFQDKAAAMRLGEYKDAMRLISRYPFFGVGFGAAPTSDLYIGVSNVYMLITEEMGLMGLGAFLLAMAVFGWQSFQAWQRALRRTLCVDPQVRGILVGGAGAIAGGLAAGFLDHYFFNIDFPHAIALFWLVVGLTMSAVRLSNDEAPEGQQA
ncbi:MAG: O-antigen ligase family protein, partial [Chloroflexi bacterium]|nr:O-antigen ligase family protein [Chloroflexota bacterium]